MASSNQDTRNQKRQQFSGGAQNKNNRIIMLVAGIGLVFVLVLYLQSTSKTSAGATRLSATGAANGTIAISLADLESGQAKFFDYTTADNKPVRFFAIKSSDGAYRAAADACDVCYGSKMGYHQEGDDMVCRKCGRHFPSKDVNVITGGCNPNGISATVQGDKLLISTADLDARAVLF